MKNRAFTLIELLVVIAIIAILAAILFPVFAQAKEAAKKTQALAQMKQLSMGVMLYAQDADDFFVPSANRVPVGDPIIWAPLVNVYVKNTQVFLAPGSDATFAADWANRRNQNIGYSEATGFDPNSTAVPGGAVPKGNEGFNSVVNFSVAEDSSSIGLLATTPNSVNGKERGYAFNPYNGPNSPDGDQKKGLPLIADVNICPTSPLTAAELKPIFAKYSATGRGDGSSPIIFADGHAKAFSANKMNAFGTVTWRFR